MPVFSQLENFIFSLAGIMTLACFFALLFFLLWRRAVLLLKETRFAKRSLSSRYGKMSEQFMPFLRHYPYQANGFRFLGTPIDGIQFEEDKIILIEFKTNQAKLTAKQKQIQELVQRKQVFFQEIRIS